MKRLLSGWQDSNLRPPAPKAGAITGLRYTPKASANIKTINRFSKCFLVLIKLILASIFLIAFLRIYFKKNLPLPFLNN